MKKYFIIPFLFLCLFSQSQITFFGVASTPTDNGTNTATTVAVTPPGSMVTGDLVVLYAYQRGASTTMSISETSGQTWNDVTGHQSSTAVLSADMFWCRYNGTWGSNPSVSFSAGTNTNVVMLVFRPSSGSNTWGLDPLSAGLNRFVSFSSGTTITNTMGQTPVNASTVGIASFMTDDDNTWGSLSGTGWSQTGLGAQYRNTSGSDVSSAYAYRIKTSSSAYESVSLNQATLGGDPGIQGGWIFYEESVTPPTPNPRRVTLISKK